MRVLNAMFLVGCLLPVAVMAQSSVGFSDPDDLETLLAYRLPSWGYRIWDLGFDLSGSGMDDRGESRSFGLGLEPGLQAYHESEQRTWSLQGESTLRYARRSASTLDGDNERHERSFLGDLTVRGNLRQYFAENAAVLMSLHLDAGYQESKLERGQDEDNRVFRALNERYHVGFGLGRIRNVTPLLRAQRVSERLRSLGRPPLSRREVLSLAATLAQHSGYLTVHDRADKVFWRDVFSSLTGDQPLTPFEVLYLAEVLEEEIGYRSEGWLFSLTAWIEHNHDEYHANELNAGPRVFLGWSHNFDLNHQLSLNLSGSYGWHDNPDNDAGRGEVSLAGAHLWVLADRVLWSTRLRGLFRHGEQKDVDYRHRDLSTSFSSTFDFYVEDHLVLQPTVRVRYDTSEYTGQDVRSRWNWQYGVTLRYYFEKALL